MTPSPMPVRVVNLRSLIGWAITAYVVWRIVDAIAATLLIFGLAAFFAILLDAPVRWLDRRGLSRGWSTGLIAIVTIGAVAGAGAVVVPTLVDQATDLAKNAPAYTRRLQERGDLLAARYPELARNVRDLAITEKLTTAAQGILPRLGKLSLSIVGDVFALLLVFVLTLYMTAAPQPLLRGILDALPAERRRMALRILARVTTQLQAWVRATGLLMLIVGLACGIGLHLIGVRSALLFGILAGIGEAIPTVGPVLSALPPFLVTLADDPTRAGFVLLVFLLVQQIENNVLVPRIMASTLNLHSVSVLFFVIAMGTMMGPLGILLATPLCAITKVVYEEVRRTGRHGRKG